MATNLKQQAMLGYAPQGNETTGLVKSRQITADADGSTTQISTPLAGAANSYNGYLLRVINASNARNIGEERIVSDCDDAGLLTVYPALPGSALSGDDYELYSTTGNPLMVVTTTGALTQFEDSGRTEAANFWKGYEAIVHSGSGVSNAENQTISASTASGTITVDANFSGSIVAGNVLYPRRFVLCENVAFSPSLEMLDRPLQTNDFSKLAKIVGGKGGTVSFDIEFTPSSARAAAGSYLTKPPYADLLECAFGTLSKSQTGTLEITGGAAVTVETVSDVATVQDAIVLGDEMRWITAENNGTYTVNEALVGTYALNELAYGTFNYKLDPQNAKHLTLDFFYDGMRVQAYNCMCDKVDVKFANGQRPMISMSFLIDHWVATDEGTPVSTAELTDIAPVPVLGCDAYVNGTAVAMSEFNISVGLTITPKADATKRNGRAGFVCTDQSSTASVSFLLEDDESLNYWQRGAAMDCFITSVSNSAGVGCWFRGQVNNVTVNDNGGIYYVQLEMQLIEQSTRTWYDLVLSIS